MTFSLYENYRVRLSKGYMYTKHLSLKELFKSDGQCTQPPKTYSVHVNQAKNCANPGQNKRNNSRSLANNFWPPCKPRGYYLHPITILWDCHFKIFIRGIAGAQEWRAAPFLGASGSSSSSSMGPGSVKLGDRKSRPEEAGLLVVGGGGPKVVFVWERKNTIIISNLVSFLTNSYIFRQF